MITKLGLKLNGRRFIEYSLYSTITFAVLYWISDKYSEKYTKIKANHFGYWLWFSLITQTTVGYGEVSSHSGKSISYITLDAPLFKTLNILQLLTTLLIPAMNI